MYKLLRILLVAVAFFPLSILASESRPVNAAVLLDGGKIYLPQIYNGTAAPSTQTNVRTINAPYIQNVDVVSNKLIEMGIFWFGKVHPDINYTDVRVGYNDEALWIRTATIDRRVWYDTNLDLEGSDAVTVLLQLNGNSQIQQPDTQTYRFVTLFRDWEGVPNKQKAYRGNGSQWVAQSITFTTVPGWRGNAINDDKDDQGWLMTLKIPFASLGLSGKPPAGSTWRLGVMIHDRDSQSGATRADQVWPETLTRQAPATWGVLHFGLPEYTQPNISNPQTTTIRNKLNGAVVPDADVGGYARCGDNRFWQEWGEYNYAGGVDFNIQNQADISDYPCFSKYYVTFPLGSIPAGKAIRSAKLILRHWGNANPAVAEPSLIQVMSVGEDWNEATLNWNNAPWAMENFDRRWVSLYTKPDPRPGDPYEWNVSIAASQAYQKGVPLRLALYSADSKDSSGKYFYSSDAWDGYAESRPTLIIEWGDPQ
jgi:hypothetical protein